MEQRALGQLEVGAVGFGAMVLSPGLYGPVEADRAAAALRTALGCGCTLIDTSDGYGTDAHNERLLGELLAGDHGTAVISTKFGYHIPPGRERHEVEIAYGTVKVNASPQLVRDYAIASLRRLGVDRIDLYSPHFPDPAVPIEETVGAMAALVDEGLVRCLGLSNVGADLLERAVAVHPISAVHCEWSMWAEPDPALIAAADRHGVGVIAWAPLGGGFLTGTLTEIEPGDIRNRFPRLSPTNLAVNNDRYAPLRALADELHLSPSELALAWLLHQHPAVVPIPGSRTPEHIEANAAAAGVTLDDDTLAGVEAVRRLLTPEGGTILDVGRVRP